MSSGGEPSRRRPAAWCVGQDNARCEPAVLSNTRRGRRGHGLAGGRVVPYVSRGRQRAATRQTTHISRLNEGPEKGLPGKEVGSERRARTVGQRGASRCHYQGRPASRWSFALAAAPSRDG